VHDNHLKNASFVLCGVVWCSSNP